MTELLHIVCPHCDAINRLPAQRLDRQPSCGQCHGPLFNGHPLALRAGNFDRHVSRNDIPVLIDFWAPWCGPCKMMAPQFEQAATLLEPRVRLVKVDTQAEPKLGDRHNIRSIPTLILFGKGHEIARQSGAMGAQDIVRWVEGHCR
jgi:thioredoxin 2